MSFLTAGTLIVAAVTMPSVQAVDKPSMDSVIGTLPDWTTIQ